MAGTARKSTHKKKSTTKTRSKSPTKAKKTPVVEIDADVSTQIENSVFLPTKIQKKYEIEKIGPVHLLWGKRRKRNNKGKVVKVSLSHFQQLFTWNLS